MRRALAFLAVLTLFLVTGIVYAPVASATVLTMHCGFSHEAQVDPILAFGVNPSAHDHVFFGNDATDENSTPDSLQADPGSSCGTAGDSAAYWAPIPFVDGVQVPVAKLHVGEYWLSNGVHVAVPPAGMEYVAGNPFAADPSESTHIRWHCRNGSGSNVLVSCADHQRGPLKAEVFFPNCWDGTDQDLNGIIDPSHFAYTTDKMTGKVCPSAFPIHIAQLGLQYNLVDASGAMLYDPYGPDGTTPRLTFSSGPWWTVHADLIQAWNMDFFIPLIDGCLNKVGACPTHS